MPIASQGLELDDMKKRLKEMEDEASALREMQVKVEKEMGSVPFVNYLFYYFFNSLDFSF